MSDNSSALATTSRQDKVMGLIQKMRPELSKVVPEAIGMERFMRVTLTTIRLNPKLAECSQASLLSSLMISAQLGLEVGRRYQIEPAGGFAHGSPASQRRQAYKDQSHLQRHA